MSEEQAPSRGAVAEQVKWSSVGLVGRESLRLAFSIALARWLGPENFGIMSQATIYVGFVAVFLDQAFGVTLVQHRSVSRSDQGAVLWATIVVAAAIVALTLVLAGPIASFFHTDQLAPVLRVLSIGVILKALTVVPQALIMRELRFRWIAIAEAGSALVGGIGGIVAAVLGAEYWSLVVQSLLIDLVTMVVLLVAAGLPAARGSWAALRSMWSFSSNAMGFGFLNYSTRNLDNILIGRQLGTAPLAQYALAYRFMMMPVQQLSLVINRVTFPAYSRLRDDLARMGRQFLVTTQMVALIAFPLMTVALVTAPLAVPLIFGPEWHAAVVPLQILALAGMQQTIVSLHGSLLMACGRADWLFRSKIASSIILIAAFVVGIHWGIVGVAVGFSVASYGFMPLNLLLLRQVVGVPMGAYVRTLIPATVGSLAGGAAGAAVMAALGGTGFPEVATLLAGTGVTLGVYAAAVVAGWSGAVQDGLTFLRLIVRRPAVPVPA